MAQRTRRARIVRTSDVRTAMPTLPLTPQEETRVAMRKMAQESGQKSVDAVRKRIEQEMRAAVRDNSKYTKDL